MSNKVLLYYSPTPNGWKISIALEEMGLGYETHLLDLTSGVQFEDWFTEISPNGRMPALMDPDGPDGTPITVFESGAILQYLARKTGQFYGETEADRVAVDQWLMWQMAGLGPNCGQAFHFLKYAPSMEPPQDLPYAKERFRSEVGRLLGVLDRQLARTEYIAGSFYSIADMACWPWASLWRGMEQTLDDKPNLQRWLEALKARPLLRKGRGLHEKARIKPQDDPSTHKVLFGSKG